MALTSRRSLWNAVATDFRRSLCAVLLVLASVVLAGAAVAAPRVVVISLDGATPRFVEQYLDSAALSGNKGLGLIKREGVTARQNVTINPSLTAPAHIAIATGSIAAHNDIPANTFHLLASPFLFPPANTAITTISGFGAPIGGYDIHGPAEAAQVTAEPLWLPLRAAGKIVVTATFPGGDGVDIRVPGLSPSPIIQPAAERTVNYTVPFGAFAGIGAQGFSLTTTDFSPAPASTVDQLNAAGRPSFSPILQKTTALESFTVGGVAYQIQVAALDTTNDGQPNYDTLVFFATAQGVQPGPFSPPSTGPAYVRAADKRSAPFYLEGSSNKAGTAYYVSQLAPDLSTVRIARYSANAIPRNAPVLADVDDINTHVGFWAPQADFRIPERLSPGFGPFPDLELEDMYEDQVRLFVDYQTRVGLRAIERFPNADLVMIYIEQPDGSGHQFMLTDPRQPTDPRNPDSIGAGQDPAKKARYAGYLKTAYREASGAVQRIIDAVGVDRHGAPRSNIFVVSDHGFEIFHTAVSMPNFLTNRGFDPAKVRAVTSGPAVNAYINLIGRDPSGTVTPAEYPTLQKQIADALAEFADTNPNYTNGQAKVPVFDKVFRRPVPASVNDPSLGLGTDANVGQDFGDVFALLTPGYNFDGTQIPVVIRKGDLTPPPPTLPVLSVPNFYGAHGYDPELTSMSAIFMAAGPDIRKGRLHRVRNIDVAPTVARLLGVKLGPTVDGAALPVRVPRDVTAALIDRLKHLQAVSDHDTDRRLQRAIDHLADSLRGRFWDDDAHLDREGLQVFDGEKDAVQELLRITGRPRAVTDVVEGIVTVAEELAAIAIDELAGVGRDDRRLASARKSFDQATGEAATGRFEQAIDAYAQAWASARNASR
jgi:hypothetical protein